MFLEIKPYQHVNLNDVIGFHMNPAVTENGGRTLYIYMRGKDRSFEFVFPNHQDCQFAYNRLKMMLEKNGNVMEDYKNGSYIY